MRPALEVAAGVIVDTRGLLITRRREGTHLAGLWEFPGGKIRRGEEVHTALHRELREELGIDVEVGRLLQVVEHSYPDTGAVRLHFHVCRIRRGIPAPLAAAEVRWVEPSAMGDLAWPPADAPLVELVRRCPDALDLWAPASPQRPHD